MLIVKLFQLNWSRAARDAMLRQLQGDILRQKMSAPALSGNSILCYESGTPNARVSFDFSFHSVFMILF